MRYKAAFSPSLLLCHETRKFVAFHAAKPFLEKHSMRLNPTMDKPDPSLLKETEERLLVVIYGEWKLITYKQALEKYGEKVREQMEDLIPLLMPLPPFTGFVIRIDFSVCERKKNSVQARMQRRITQLIDWRISCS